MELSVCTANNSVEWGNILITIAENVSIELRKSRRCRARATHDSSFW